MRLCYLDTSAAMKLLVDEVESAALLNDLQNVPRRLVASWLLHTELHCAAGRHPDVIRTADVTTVLSTVNLIDLSRGDLLTAGTRAPLRSNDAIHFAVALRLGVDELITYDVELGEAAKAAGVSVLAPA